MTHQPISDMKDSSRKEFSMAQHSIPESPSLPFWPCSPQGLVLSKHIQGRENMEKSDCVV